MLPPPDGPPPTSVEVDTPELRELKAEAGVEDCEPGPGGGALPGGRGGLPRRWPDRGPLLAARPDGHQLLAEPVHAVRAGDADPAGLPRGVRRPGGRPGGRLGRPLPRHGARAAARARRHLPPARRPRRRPPGHRDVRAGPGLPLPRVRRRERRDHLREVRRRRVGRGARGPGRGAPRGAACDDPAPTPGCRTGCVPSRTRPARSPSTTSPGSCPPRTRRPGSRRC